MCYATDDAVNRKILMTDKQPTNAALRNALFKAQTGKPSPEATEHLRQLRSKRSTWIYELELRREIDRFLDEPYLR